MTTASSTASPAGVSPACAPEGTGLPTVTLTVTGIWKVVEAVAALADVVTAGVAGPGFGRGAGVSLDCVRCQAASKSVVDETWPSKFSLEATRGSRASSYIGTA